MKQKVGESNKAVLDKLVAAYLTLRAESTSLEARQLEINAQRKKIGRLMLSVMPTGINKVKTATYTISRTKELESMEGFTADQKKKITKWAIDNDCIMLSWSRVKSAVKNGVQVPFLAGRTYDSVSVYDNRKH